MSEAVAIAFVNNLPATLAAFGALGVTVWNSYKTGKQQKAIAINDSVERHQVAEKLAEKVEVVASGLAKEVATTAKDLAAKNTEQTTAITQKTDEIHKMVNSNLTEVKTNLITANDQIRALQAVVERLERQAMEDRAARNDAERKLTVKETAELIVRTAADKPAAPVLPVLSVPIEVKVVNPPEQPVPVIPAEPRGEKD